MDIGIRLTCPRAARRRPAWLALLLWASLGCLGAEASGKAQLTPLIDRIAKQHRLDPALVHALIAVESGYDTRAVSKAGARGLMQVLPTTARDYGVEDPERLFDPEVNLTAGAKHLHRLLSRYRNISHALMAYHAGEGEFSDFRRDGIFAETRRYMILIVTRYLESKGRAPERGQSRPQAIER